MLVEMKGIHKSFGMLHVLKGVDFRVDSAEIVGLVGDNAAGKSTLMKVLSGLYTYDEGSIGIAGVQAPNGDPRTTRMLGIEMVYQDFALAPHLSVAENIMLGREETRFRENGFFLNRKKMLDRALRVLSVLETDIPAPERPVMNLSGGQRQMVAIARALCFNPKLIIMDEPTANISVGKVSHLLKIIKDLRERGISVIIISHRMHDIFEVADRIVVLRHGQVAGERLVSETTPAEIVGLMTGISA